MEESKITVVVPAYNAEKTIDKTLKSILGGGMAQYRSNCRK